MTDEKGQANDQKAAQEQSGSKDEKPRLLMLLEDDLALRSLLQIMFQQWGYQTLTFSDGYRAAAWLDQIAEGSVTDPLPELALLDIRVPGPQGTEIAMRMRKLSGTAQIPIVIMTAYRMDSAETDEILKAIEPEGFLQKGDMDFDSLHKQLMSILTKRKELVPEGSSSTVDAKAAPEKQEAKPAASNSSASDEKAIPEKAKVAGASASVTDPNAEPEKEKVQVAAASASTDPSAAPENEKAKVAGASASTSDPQPAPNKDKEQVAEASANTTDPQPASGKSEVPGTV